MFDVNLHLPPNSTILYLPFSKTRFNLARIRLPNSQSASGAELSGLAERYGLGRGEFCSSADLAERMRNAALAARAFVGETLTVEVQHHVLLISQQMRHPTQLEIHGFFTSLAGKPCRLFIALFSPSFPARSDVHLSQIEGYLAAMQQEHVVPFALFTGLTPTEVLALSGGE